ncbi:hypothetical protein PHISP_02864 [Aspergillus sp. HF37]|nr:hypothetical protein PHISP_02864 [Aspergillus sp. HF37]
MSEPKEQKNEYHVAVSTSNNTGIFGNVTDTLGKAETWARRWETRRAAQATR